jgi:hypothetical protein
MHGLVERRVDIATTEVVVMEVLAGARSPRHHAELRAALLDYPMLVLDGLADYEQAALIYRICRTAGETIRDLSDCLIAVPAIRAEASILHKDRDFDVIARHTPLRIEPVDTARP